MNINKLMRKKYLMEIHKQIRKYSSKCILNSLSTYISFMPGRHFMFLFCFARLMLHALRSYLACFMSMTSVVWKTFSSSHTTVSLFFCSFNFFYVEIFPAVQHNDAF